MFNNYQKKNQRNEKRLSFAKAYFNSFLEDLVSTNAHQHSFADKIIQGFEKQDRSSIPEYEQGVYQLLDSVQESRKSLLQVKQAFEKSVLEPLNTAIKKHAELYSLIEKSVLGFEHYKELLAKSSKDYENYTTTFNASMIESKKKVTLDVFSEAHKYSTSVQRLVATLAQISDNLIAMRKLAIAKEIEYLKALTKAYKDFSLFVQQHLGQLTASILLKARFKFDKVAGRLSDQ